MATLDDLLSSLPGYASITEGMKQAALDGACIPDANNVWPGADGYQPTYDFYFAAANLVGFLQAQPAVTSSKSEGTSVSVSAPDWTRLLAYFRSLSPIYQADGNSLLQRVEIPEGPHVRRTNMFGRSGSYGDVDTDLS